MADILIQICGCIAISVASVAYAWYHLNRTHMVVGPNVERYNRFNDVQQEHWSR